MTFQSAERKVRLSNPQEEYINRIKENVCASPPVERKLSATLAEIEKKRLDILDAKGTGLEGKWYLWC